MPTYKYECAKCGYQFEKFQNMTDPHVKSCPKCRGRKVRRLISSGSGLIFKGKGFYQTDYKTSPGDTPKKNDTGSKPAKCGDTGCSCCDKS